jgi:diaminopimelate epimerase
MQFDYVKMHGTGNRILVVDQREKNMPPPDSATLRRLGNEATGPGFDQLMWVTAAQHPGNIAAYRVFNADGTEVEQCGNGVRCIALALAREASVPREFTLESPAGPVSAAILSSCSTRWRSTGSNLKSSLYQWATRTASCRLKMSPKPPSKSSGR